MSEFLEDPRIYIVAAAAVGGLIWGGIQMIQNSEVDASDYERRETKPLVDSSVGSAALAAAPEKTDSCQPSPSVQLRMENGMKCAVVCGKDSMYSTVLDKLQPAPGQEITMILDTDQGTTITGATTDNFALVLQNALQNINAEYYNPGSGACVPINP